MAESPIVAPAPAAPATRRRPGRVPAFVWIPAVATAIALGLPLVWLVIRAASGGSEALAVAVEPTTLGLLRTTFLLVLAVTATTAVIGTALAFLVTRTDVPFRRALAALTALPLVLPTYVGAYTLVAALAPGGLVEEVFAGLGIEGVRPPSPYGFGGAWITLSLFTYPYVLLTVRGALRGLDPSLEEASRTLGDKPWQTFRRVTLPQLRPSIAAGSLLVSLYVLSDFGAVSLLRTSTFTRAIYLQYQSAFDRTPAAVLGLQLVLFTVAVLVVEARVGGDRRGRTRAARASVHRRASTVALRRWRWPAFGFAAMVLVLALAVPLGVTGWWLARGLAAGEPLRLTFQAMFNSLEVAGLAAVASVLAAGPVAVWVARHPSRIGRLVERGAYAGYALPGIVVALAFVFFGARFGGPLYQTLVLLVAAYVVLFLPQALGAMRTSLAQVPAGAEDAARTLGSSPAGALVRVVLPMARRGAVAGGALVFLTTLKELPATLLLAPIGFPTLATQVWAATEAAFFARAAAPALLLMLVGSLPLAVMELGRDDGH